MILLRILGLRLLTGVLFWMFSVCAVTIAFLLYLAEAVLA